MRLGPRVLDADRFGRGMALQRMDAARFEQAGEKSS